MRKSLEDYKFLKTKNIITCVYMDIFTDVIGKYYSGCDKYRITFKHHLTTNDRLKVINVLADKFGVNIEIQHKCFFVTTMEQVNCVVEELGFDMVYEVDTLPGRLLDFLKTNKLLFEKWTIHRARRIREWLAKYLELKWYDIKIGNVGFQFMWYGKLVELKL